MKRFSKCIKISRDNQSANDNLLIVLTKYDQRRRHPHQAENKFSIKEGDLRKVIAS
jgi:hypothetical protein